MHRNLLFPLLQNECDSQGEEDVNVMDTDPEEDYWLADEQSEYEGPTMRSRSKRQVLAKVNLLMILMIKTLNKNQWQQPQGSGKE